MQEKISQRPPEPMTWGGAAPYLIGAFVFDALRFLFVMFWFFGPAFAALYCTAEVGGVLKTWTAGVLGDGTALAVCGVASAAVGTIALPAIEAFGTVMAMAVGFLGWLSIGGLLVMRNPKIFKASAGNGLWFVFGLFISEIPFVGALPAMTVSVGKLFRTQIKKEKADMEKYEEAHAAELKQEREQQMTQVTQAQNARIIQTQQQEIAEQEAVDKEQFEQEQAANDEQFAEEEIPEQVRRAT